MKILYFHQHFSTPKGSAGTRSFAIAQRLVQLGHEVTMICGSYSQGDTGLEGQFKAGRRMGMVSGIKVVEFDIKYSNSQAFSQRLWSFLSFTFRATFFAIKYKTDLVVCTSTPLTIAIPGIFCKIIKNSKFLFEVRDLWPQVPIALGKIRNPFLIFAARKLETIAYKKSDHIIALSPGMYDGILSTGISPEKITVVPNGCDNFNAVTKVKSVKQKTPFFDSTMFNIVYAGTHGFANNLKQVLQAAEIVQNKGFDRVAFHFFGIGQEKEFLINYASNKMLNNTLFHEPKAKEDLFPILAQADVGLQLRNQKEFYEGTSPNKFFDYISCGLPVIVNYRDGCLAIVLSAQCGIVVAPNDPHSLALNVI